MRAGVLLTFLASMAGLTACNVLDDGSLAQIDVAGGPLKADPSKIEVLVELPPGLGIPEGAAVLNVSAARDDIGAQSSGAYVLEQSATGEGLRRFRVAPSDVDRLKGQQALISDWESEAPDRLRTSLFMDVTGCKVGAGPQPTASVAFFAVVLPNKTPRRLGPPVPVTQILDAIDQRTLPAC